ncbi:MAG: glycosyltransferase [Hyphomonadaceae bacterium]
MSLKLLPDLQQLSQVSQPQHRFLAEGFERPEGPNIGRNGEHLTIMFLSLNRSGLSERLCRSIVEHIPDFKGEILAIDNGSTEDEFEAVSAMLDSLPFRTRIVRFDQNYGVAGGRNRGMAHVETEWVMSVDNDIYFISNPLPHWQNEIATLGCRFFSLALYDPGLESVFLRGGHLYVSWTQEDIILGGGSCCQPTDARAQVGDPFMGTCMMGGASIYHADAFRRMGMYDDAMFIGFEDYEFSLRLFREGYKIGCTALAALVHDHPKPEKKEDTEYEKVRFRRDYMSESAAHFEQKHGFKVWHKGVDTWLAERERELGIETSAGQEGAQHDRRETQADGGPVKVISKPKLLMVIDQTGWAFSNISDQVTRHLSDRYDIQTTAAYELDSFGQIFLLGRDADLVHFFWRPHLLAMFDGYLDGYARTIGMNNTNDLRWHMLQKKLTTAVYDHLFLDPDSVRRYGPILENLIDGYYTSSAKLDQIYRRTYPKAVPTGLIPDGVDLGLFQRKGVKRTFDEDRPLVVGWVGNSKWAADIEDFKGLHTIIRPALAELAEEGVHIDEVFADRNVSYIPHALMPDYYRKIDILLCASKIEGTPNPVLEAMACGVPVVTTDVGIVPDVMGPLQREFILAERDKDHLKAALRKLNKERWRLAELSAENLISIEPWDWKRKVRPFEQFFDAVLAKPARERSPHPSEWLVS